MFAPTALQTPSLGLAALVACNNITCALTAPPPLFFHGSAFTWLGIQERKIHLLEREVSSTLGQQRY